MEWGAKNSRREVATELNRLGNSKESQELKEHALKVLGMTAQVRDKAYDRGEHIEEVRFLAFPSFSLSSRFKTFPTFPLPYFFFCHDHSCCFHDGHSYNNRLLMSSRPSLPLHLRLRNAQLKRPALPIVTCASR